MFLLANSLHLRTPSHPTPLVNALIVMEIGLLYILYVMLQNIMKNMRSALKIKGKKVNLFRV